MLTKTTQRLFKGIYQYKIVLICAGASWFRGGDWDGALAHFKSVEIPPKQTFPVVRNWNSVGIRTQEDLDYAIKLQSVLKKLTDIEIRVESPWISLYTNTKANVEALVKLDKSRVKYISVPADANTLVEGVVILPKIDYEYRVTLGKTTQEHSAFIDWAEANSKVKLTKGCKKELSKNMSWGGSYFYITGEKNLLLAKMHLGGSINKIERVVKA